MSFQHSLLYEGKRWWRSVNREGGWAVVDNGKEAVSQSVMTLIETVRARIQQSVTFQRHQSAKMALQGHRRRAGIFDRWNLQI
jgi:hypothetical protein